QGRLGFSLEQPNVAERLLARAPRGDAVLLGQLVLETAHVRILRREVDRPRGFQHLDDGTLCFGKRVTGDGASADRASVEHLNGSGQALLKLRAAGAAKHVDGDAG